MINILVLHRVNVMFSSRFLFFTHIFRHYQKHQTFSHRPTLSFFLLFGLWKICVVSHSIFSAYNVLLKFISSSICCFSKKDSFLGHSFKFRRTFNTQKLSNEVVRLNIVEINVYNYKQLLQTFSSNSRQHD